MAGAEAAVTFAAEDTLAIRHEISALLPEHMNEFDIYGAPFASAPDVDLYAKLANAGRLSVILTARAGSVLVGYWLGFLFPDPHHRFAGEPVIVAMSQAFHILPPYRRQIARRFFRFIEEWAAASGALLVVQRVRPIGRSEQFLVAIGYTAAEAVLVKPIGKARHAGFRS